MNVESALLAAIRAQPWAILPGYLELMCAIVSGGNPKLLPAALDGHQERLEVSRAALAAVGGRLDGTMTATLRDGTAVLPVFGAIYPRANMVNDSTGGTSLDILMRDFRVAQASNAVERIVMVFDTPGGAVSGLAEAADGLRAASKPVVAHVTGIAASAGYWLASQAREVVLDRTAMVGSIGAVMSMSRQEAPGADGRREYQIVSKGAPYKRPDPSTEEGRAAIQEMVDAAEDVFVSDVARGRGVSPATVRSEFGRGGMLTGAAAVAAGMADRIGTLESVLQETGRTRTANSNGRRAQVAAEIETRRRAAQSEI